MQSNESKKGQNPDNKFYSMFSWVVAAYLCTLTAAPVVVIYAPTQQPFNSSALYGYRGDYHYLLILECISKLQFLRGLLVGGAATTDDFLDGQL
mgnify:CR=1 FL=1|jgi:hypothetical protein|tara:strand:+ start:14677 stop:14958 length:282 start_codon:yes stop_codon:yes gene_type:complete